MKALLENLSWVVYKSDSTRLLLKCRDKTCTFGIRAAYSKNHDGIQLAAYKAHVCGVDTHFNYKVKSSVKSLKEWPRARILDDKKSSQARLPCEDRTPILTKCIVSYKRRAAP